jgi:hypothetical protein
MSDQDSNAFTDLTRLPPILTTEEVAGLFRVCPATILRSSRRDGGLVPVAGLRVGRFTRESVLAALAKGSL